MTAWQTAAAIVIALAARGDAHAQGTPVGKPLAATAPIALVDSSGNVAARPLNETIMLVPLGGGVVAPAQIRAMYGPDGRAASGLATWHSGGSVLFTSADCTAGAHVYSPTQAAIRGAAQV